MTSWPVRYQFNWFKKPIDNENSLLRGKEKRIDLAARGTCVSQGGVPGHRHHFECQQIGTWPVARPERGSEPEVTVCRCHRSLHTRGARCLSHMKMS